MLALQFSLKKSKIITAVFAIVGTILAVVCFTATVRILDKPSQSVNGLSLNVENGDYGAFFGQLGIEADTDNISRKSVTIPCEFNKTYEAYNELQNRAGLDLSGYRGKKAEMLTFPISSNKADTAVLLVLDGRVIGGHLTNREYGGEMLPLIVLKADEDGTTG